MRRSRIAKPRMSSQNDRRPPFCDPRTTLRVEFALRTALSNIPSPRSTKLRAELLRTIADLPRSVASEVLKYARLPNLRYLASQMGTSIATPGFMDAWDIYTVDDVLNHAADVANSIGDVHVGTEHVVAAVLDSLWRSSAQLPKASELSPDVISRAILRYRPEAGWPTPHVDLTVDRYRATWDTHLLDLLYAPAPPIVPLGTLTTKNSAPKASVCRSPAGRHAAAGTPREWGRQHPRKTHLLAQLSRESLAVQLGSVRLYPLGCSGSDLETISSMCASRLDELIRCCSNYLGFDATGYVFDVICLGAQPESRSLPSEIQSWLANHPPWAGLVSDELQIAFLNMQYRNCFSQSLVHELVHLLVSCALGLQLAPDVINEGFAYAMEARFAYEIPCNSSPAVWPSLRLPRREGVCTSPVETRLSSLFLDSGQTPCAKGLRYATHVFLAEQNYPECRLSGLLQRVAAAHPRDGRVVLSLIASELGLSIDELDKRFDTFCNGRSHQVQER